MSTRVVLDESVVLLLVEVAMVCGTLGGVLALAVASLVREGYCAAVAAFDEREARKRLTEKHYRELFGDRDDEQ